MSRKSTKPSECTNTHMRPLHASTFNPLEYQCLKSNEVAISLALFLQNGLQTGLVNNTIITGRNYCHNMHNYTCMLHTVHKCMELENDTNIER